jgi:predicted dehydrogenase
MKIGIVGAENSHTVAIAKTLNIEKAVSGCEVTHVWGETAEYADKAAEDGRIPNIVQEPPEMIGQVEGVVVDHRHAKHHLAAARPFIEAGVPVFVDKPFCIDLKEGIDFVNLARSKNTPLTSYSVLPMQQSAREFEEAMKGLGTLRSFVTAGPVEIESEYGGVFFYGIHQVDFMLSLVEAKPMSVSTARQGEDGIATITFDSGAFGVVHCLNGWSGGFTGTVYGEKGAHHAALAWDQNIYLTGIKTFCRMFETRQEPLPPSSYLRPVAVLAAMQKSFDTGNAVDVAAVDV